MNIIALLLRLPEIQHLLFDSPQPTDMKRDFCDGCLSPKDNMSRLTITLYCDELCICNLIGQGKKKHKLTMFYFQVLNVPPNFRSKVSSVFPLAVAYTKSLRNNMYTGVRTLLQDFIDTFTKLSTTGITVLVKGEKMRLMGHLAGFIGDSLAANAIGGFKEGFSASVKRCCRACNSTRDEMELFSLAQQCILRNKEEHKTRLAELQRGFRTIKIYKFWSKMYGITSDCALSAIPGFDVTKSLLFDPMHDIFEGIFPLQLERLLSVHIARNTFSLDAFNIFMATLAPIPTSDRPNVITNNLKICATQKAGQMLSLLRTLPFFYAICLGNRRRTLECHDAIIAYCAAVFLSYY
jgi:hypothetical protein